MDDGLDVALAAAVAAATLLALAAQAAEVLGVAQRARYPDDPARGRGHQNATDSSPPTTSASFTRPAYFSRIARHGEHRKS